MPRIDSLRIENFRGASIPFELTFAPKKTLVVIFGENGTGKTTIVDALDAVGNGSGGSLTTRSSTTLKKHLPTLGKKPGDMKLEVASGTTTWTAALGTNGIVTNPHPRPPIRVLRRINLQRFIDSQPGKRYEELKHLIGVERVERSEDALKRAFDSARAEFDQAVRDRLAAESQLEAIWREEGAPGVDWTSWAQAAASVDATALTDRIQRLRATRHAIEDAVRAKSDWDRAEDGVSQCRLAAAQVDEEVTAEPALDAAKAMRLAEMLGEVRRYLVTGGDGDRCPVCGTDVPLADLQASVNQRLDELARYDELAKRQRSAHQRVRAAEDEARRASEHLDVAAARLWTIADSAPDGFAPLTIPAARTAPAAVLVAACAPLVAAFQKSEDTDLAASARASSIRSLWSTLNKGVQDAKDLEQIVKGLAAAHEITKQGRITFTQGILDDVADECNRLYEAIHPGEGLASAKIVLDLKRRASINQTVDFGGQADVPPQAYFSEAHLDTFGFCFWLAFAKREHPDGDAVLVLDDVFSSVDAAHLSRVTDVIVNEREHFAQIIITTHQRGWRDSFTNAYGPGNWTDLIELQSWSLAGGMYSEQTPMAIDALRAELHKTPFDRQAAAAKAGILLEATLDRLTYRYGCQVPRRRSNAYTLDELLSATSKLFKQMSVAKPRRGPTGEVLAPIRFDPVAPDPADLVTQLKPLVPIRNRVGAHYNPDGQTVSDAEVRAFATLAARLVESLVCETCGQIPSKDAGTHLKCSCKADVAARMTPMELV